MSTMRIGIRGTTSMSILALLSVLFLSAAPAENSIACVINDKRKTCDK